MNTLQFPEARTSSTLAIKAIDHLCQKAFIKFVRTQVDEYLSMLSIKNAIQKAILNNTPMAGAYRGLLPIVEEALPCCIPTILALADKLDIVGLSQEAIITRAAVSFASDPS